MFPKKHSIEALLLKSFLFNELEKEEKQSFCLRLVCIMILEIHRRGAKLVFF